MVDRHRSTTKDQFSCSTSQILGAFCFIIVLYCCLCYLLYSYVTQTNHQGNNPYTPLKEEVQSPNSRARDSDIDNYIRLAKKCKDDGRWNESMAFLDEGLSKYNDSDKLVVQKGGWYYDKQDYENAVIWYRRASELKPNEARYLSNIAQCYNNLHREWEATPFYEKAYHLNPDVPKLLAYAQSLWKFNNWTDHDKVLKEVLDRVRDQLKDGRSNINSFTALHYPFNLAELREIASISSHNTYRNVRRRLGNSVPTFKHSPRPPGQKIVVGYVSYDYRQHAVGVQIQSMFAMHNKSRFEIIAYNANNGKRDPNTGSVTDKIRAGVDKYVDIGDMATVAEVAQRIYDDKVDILIDLGLFTAYARMDVFTLRPAPIQAAWLGLATTTGGEWMDYVIADPVVAPFEHEKFYAEKIAQMPHSYHIFDHKQTYQIRPAFDRVEQNLPLNKFLFCNHANNIRLNPEIFDHWVNILGRVGTNSTLILKHFNDVATNNIKNYARGRGLKVTDNFWDSQILFTPGIGGSDHIPLKSCCDLFLDVHWYNGHSTSGDMLFAGVPMVTYPGESMASRAAASFSFSSGAPQMVAWSGWEEYEDLAVKFATDSEFYAKTRKTVEQARVDGPLFDTPRFVRNLERLYEIMYDRFQKGLAPDHIRVEKANSA